MTVTAFTGRVQTLSLFGGTLDLEVQVQGAGPPLVYLHPAAGLAWDRVLDQLSQRYTVYAPVHPGTGADHASIHRVQTWTELLLCYEELLRTLGLDRPVLMGASYGGMMAADLAAHFPDCCSKLVLLAPIGLWRDDAPIPLMKLVASMPEQITAQLFHDPGCTGARSLFTPGPDAELNIKTGAAFVWSLGCTGKFFWPIADHGLERRLHRITAPTLLIWGRQDVLVPARYAELFAHGIRGARCDVIDACGHMLQLEQPEQTIVYLDGFLAPAKNR